MTDKTPASMGATFAERKAAREAAEQGVPSRKQVSDAENKAVEPDETKSRSRKK